MAEAQEYKKVSTTPKTRVSTTSRTGLISDTGTSSNPQYVSNTRTGSTSAFTPASAPIPLPTNQYPNPQAQVTQAAGPNVANPTGGFAASTTGQQGKTSSNEHLYGFAGDNFALTDLPTVWQNPWLIVNKFLESKGMDTPRLREELRQYGDVGLPLFTMLHGLTDDPSDLGSSATINWISRFLNSMTTPGGNVPGYEQLLGNLLGARGDKTILGEALNSGTGQDQVNTLMTYLRSALGTNTLNPIAASAILSQANREGDNFLGATMGGQDGYQRNFTDWLNSGGHRLFGS